MKHTQLIVSAFIATTLSTTAFSYGDFVKDSSGKIVATKDGCLHYGNPKNLTKECSTGASSNMPKKAEVKPSPKKVESKPVAAAPAKVVPAPAPVVKEIISLDGVTFKTGSNQLTGGSLNTLDSVAQQLKAKPDTKIIVAGHTDSTGNAQKNLQLSQARAEAVREHLISQGVSSEQLVAKGFGDTEAIATNDTSEGRAKNRRVELRILK